MLGVILSHLNSDDLTSWTLTFKSSKENNNKIFQQILDSTKKCKEITTYKKVFFALKLSHNLFFQEEVTYIYKIKV